MAKRVLMYLYNTKSLGITYQNSGDEMNVPLIFEHASVPNGDALDLTNIPITSVDSDYAMESGRSRMGKVVTLNNGPIAWFSILGKTIATSTCEAEINAAVVAVKDLMHTKQLLVDLGYLDEDMPLYVAEDNSAAIAQAKSGIAHVKNAKHYQVKLRFLQQKVHEGIVKFLYCPTEFQLADLFTKNLETEKFVKFRDILMGLRPSR
jgi:hypothetical protein